MSAPGDIGKKGERAAQLYLEGKGYQFVAANVHIKRDEIDLIMIDGETYVFVEVKLRRQDGARAAVDAGKRIRISRAAIIYLANSGLLERSVRFDVVEVLYTSDHMEFAHIENAFLPVRGKYFV